MKKLGFLFILFFVSSCGFEPLYVEKTSDDKWFFGNEFDISINQEMEKIQIKTSGERFGQLVKNNLLDILTPKGVPEEPKYRLYVEVLKEVVSRQALRRDITATRERVEYRVIYYMMYSNDELFRSDSVAYVSYDIMANPYSTTTAEKDAMRDAAKIISEDIALRIGAFFHLETNKDSNGSI